MQLTSHRISYRKVVPEAWKHTPTCFSSIDLSDDISWGTALTRPDVKATLILVCPLCVAPRDCSMTALTSKGVWKPINCRQCHFARSSAKWSCLCNIPWYACGIHAKIGHLAGMFSRPAVKGRPSTYIHTDSGTAAMAPSHGSSDQAPVEGPSSKRLRLDKQYTCKNTPNPRKRAAGIGPCDGQAKRQRRRRELEDLQAISAFARMKACRQQMSDGPGMGGPSENTS